MLVSRLTLDLVVHQSGYIVLEHATGVNEHILSRTLVDLVLQLNVFLQNLLVGVGEIILTAVGTRHNDIGTNWGRCDCQVLDDHVLWARDLRLKSQDAAVFIRHV